MVPAGILGKRALRAYVDASPAVDALLLAVDEVLAAFPGKRTAAPDTAQRAPFQEHYAPDAWPVVDHEALDAGHLSSQRELCAVDLFVAH